jgi:hypothetical protein
MAEEETEESRTNGASDEEGQRDQSERSGSADGGEPQSAPEGGQDAGRPAGTAISRFRAAISNRKKTILVGVLGLVSIAVALSGKSGLQGVPGVRLYPLLSDSSAEGRGQYVEETLSPFFVPLPSSSSEHVAVIDFTVIWDGLASVRYKRKELQIRDSLYRHILERAKEGFDLQGKTPILEAEMSRTFQESMGTKEIEIRIKRVKVL